MSANKNTRQYSIEEINKLSENEFVELFGGIYEHSPWVAEAAAAGLPFGSRDDIEQTMKACVQNASVQQRLAILKAHPEFAGVASVELTESSCAEQSSLSLNALPPAQHARMQAINKQFMDKFGFPGIVAVRLHTSVEDIFTEFDRRLENDAEREQQEAIEQVYAIVRFRLHDLVS